MRPVIINVIVNANTFIAAVKAHDDQYVQWLKPTITNPYLNLRPFSINSSLTVYKNPKRYGIKK